MSKPKVFLNVGTYLPGYRGGGPTQSIKNLVKALSDDFEFYIFTANHDLGIKEPYDTVESDKWNKYDGVNIFYSSDKNKKRNLNKILKKQTFSIIFLNSFFNTDTIRVLILRRQLKLSTPIILMPRGELSEGALNIKKTKKMFYLNVVRTIGLLKGIKYLTTANDEYEQVHKLLHTDKVYKVSNIPNTKKELTLNTKEDGHLKIVFLSRITPKKNLDYALETLKGCKEKITFDIFGIIEEMSYWKKCQEIIKTLPNNISVNYQGELPNEEVISTLSKYDLFYFPTKSENYGHVISEALQASIPVLISDQTPWKKLEEKELGWEYPLRESKFFSSKIDELSLLNKENHNDCKYRLYNEYNQSDELVRSKNAYQSIMYKMIDC